MNQPVNQGSVHKMWYVVGAIIVIVALAYWYARSGQPQGTGAQSTAAGEMQIAPLSSGNTTAAISADLNQTPDDSAALNQAASASAQAVSGF